MAMRARWVSAVVLVHLLGPARAQTEGTSCAAHEDCNADLFCARTCFGGGECELGAVGHPGFCQLCSACAAPADTIDGRTCGPSCPALVVPQVDFCVDPGNAANNNTAALYSCRHACETELSEFEMETFGCHGSQNTLPQDLNCTIHAVYGPGDPLAHGGVCCGGCQQGVYDESCCGMRDDGQMGCQDQHCEWMCGDVPCWEDRTCEHASGVWIATTNCTELIADQGFWALDLDLSSNMTEAEAANQWLAYYGEICCSGYEHSGPGHDRSPAPQCPSGFALCPAVTVACTGSPAYDVVAPTCTGTTHDGYDCQVVFEHGRAGEWSDGSNCPDECVYTNDYPTCTVAWLDDLFSRADPSGMRPWRVCDRDSNNSSYIPHDNCEASCPPGCDLRWDAPALGPVGVCVPIVDGQATCVSETGLPCDGFTSAIGPNSCPSHCTYTGPPCQNCPGHATATAINHDADGQLMCTHAATCSDTDGDPSNGNPQEFTWCRAGKPASNFLTQMCGDGGCDRETCCDIYTPEEILSLLSQNCPNREIDLSMHLLSVQDLSLRDAADWMQAPEEVQEVLWCLLSAQEVYELCHSSGMGGFQRGVLQDFCGDQITQGLESCPTEEHHHCCSCYSNDYPLRPDDGHCCGDCAAICSDAASALPSGDVCAGVSGKCDPIAFMQVLMDTLKTEELGIPNVASDTYASALSMIEPDKVGVFCACRAVGTKMILQGGSDRDAAEAVEGDSCLPYEHSAGGDSFPMEAGPCTTGVHINLGGGGSTYNISGLDSSTHNISSQDGWSDVGYPAGPFECRWSITCPAGFNPSVSFSEFLLDSHSLGQFAADGDLVTELELMGECNPGQPGIEDFNNPTLYGADSHDDLPVIRWEIEESTPAVGRAGVDVTAVRSTGPWEHIEYQQQSWVNQDICATGLGQLSDPAVYCEAMVGTYSECEAACSATRNCMGFDRNSAAPDDEMQLCSLLRDVRDTADFPHVDGHGFVTYVKRHTILYAGVWTKTDEGEKSTWVHASECYELEFESDGFEVDIKCRDLENFPGEQPVFGDYSLDFKSDSFHCKPFEGRGDYIRLYDGRTVDEPFVDMVSTCAAITEISAPVHNCTGNAFSASYPNGTQATPQCVLDWSSDSDLVRFWDPVYSGPLDEYCPYGCDETRSPGQYSCSGDCEVNPAGTTCTGAPFLCRPPRMTSAELNFTRCFDATDALSCASMQSDDDDTGVPLGCIGISTPDEVCSSIFEDRGGNNRACPIQEEEESCHYHGPQTTCTNGAGQTTCDEHASIASDCVDDQGHACVFEDFTFLMNGETSTDCYARFQSQLSSGVHGDHASICTSTHAACQYQPTFLCQAHHHEASCQPQEAVFTGVAGSDDAPSTGDARSYVATGQNLLFAVNVRGDDDDRHHARSACADSYLADSSEDQRCAPGCVAAVVDADDGPEETCLPMSDVGGFHAAVECIAGTGGGR